MQIIEWTEFLKNGLPVGQKKTSVTVGVFDGVHRGHQALIKKIIFNNSDNIPVIITFRKPEANEAVMFPNKPIRNFNERLEIFKKLGIKIVIVIDFTEEFKDIRGIEFLEILLKQCNIGFFAVGKNFHCGNKKDTDAQQIKDFFVSRNIPVEIIPEVIYESRPVSSSRIRSALACGDVELAKAMLGGDSDL